QLTHVHDPLAPLSNPIANRTEGATFSTNVPHGGQKFWGPASLSQHPPHLGLGRGILCGRWGKGNEVSLLVGCQRQQEALWGNLGHGCSSPLPPEWVPLSFRQDARS